MGRLIGLMDTLAVAATEEYTVFVRRSLAVLLLVIFSSSLSSPVLSASDPDSKLPPCCRRSGKHRCATKASLPESSSGPALRASRCPSYRTTKVVPVNRLVSLSVISQAGFSAPIYRPAIRPRTQSLCRSSFSRARQKRGPPALFS